MRTYVCPSCLIARYVRRCFHVSHPETDSWDPSASHRSTRLDRPYMDRMPPSIHLDDSYACIMFMCHSILSYLLGIHRSIGFLCLRKLLLHFLPFGKKKKAKKNAWARTNKREMHDSLFMHNVVLFACSMSEVATSPASWAAQREIWSDQQAGLLGPSCWLRSLPTLLADLTNTVM